MGARRGRTQQKKAELLRLFELRSSPRFHAADCNSSGLVAFTAGGELSVMGPVRFFESQVPRLFREATQRNTVTAIECTAGVEEKGVEIHVLTVVQTYGRRPTGPVIAHPVQCTRTRMAEARGGLLSIST